MTEALEMFRPADAAELGEVIAEAAASARVLEVRSGGSKRDVGRPRRGTSLVDLSALTGVVAYEPSELVLTARPATPLADVEALLASRGQMLAFEPWDHGPLFGRAPGEATIGGVVAAGVAGSRRVSAGGARDHLLGFIAVSGRGERFKGGGKVVKNVTGYDVSKVIAGSWGQLAVMTELTLKVVPRPRAAATVTLIGLPASAAIGAMAKALGSPTSPAAAAHVPALDPEQSITAIRLEGFIESVAVRVDQLIAALADFAAARLMPAEQADELWASVREVRALAASETLWRIHVAPSRTAALADELEVRGATWLCDWAGALIWAGAPADAAIRQVAETCGAHAMLVRGPLELCGRTPIRQPEATAITALTGRLKQAFDPAGILDPRRFD
jgi:glycolate oxidase FAD binding subunit